MWCCQAAASGGVKTVGERACGAAQLHQVVVGLCGVTVRSMCYVGSMTGSVGMSARAPTAAL